MADRRNGDTERLHISWQKRNQHRTDLRFDQDPGGGWGTVYPVTPETVRIVHVIADNYDAEIVDPEDILGQVERGEAGYYADRKRVPVLRSEGQS